MLDETNEDKGALSKEVPSLDGEPKIKDKIPLKKETPKEPSGGLSYDQQVLPKPENQFKKIPLDGFTKDEFDKKFPETYLSDEDYRTKLAKTQSTLDRTGNLLGRVIANTIGGTIQGIGATAELPSSIYDEIKGKDADFDNSFMELGKSIQDYAKKNLPNYRLNPNQSWDVKDPAWWFDGVESAFTALQFIVPTMGVVKGVGALAKLTKAEQILSGLGVNAEKAKYFGKIGVGAVAARNAENMVESYQVRQDIKSNLLQEWKDNPEALDKAKESDAAQELIKQGREVNEENLANFIGGKAGWRSYAVNSANVVFDAMQLAPMFKGFNPSTRLGRFGTSSSILEANAKAINPLAKGASKMDKLFDIMNPMLSGIGRSASEGLEEAVNYIGTEEGKHYSKQLLNKDAPDFTTRMSNYLKSGDLYESAFWGAMGGGLYEGSMNGINHAVNLTKGNKSNIEADYRMSEIANRATFIDEASKAVKNVVDDKGLSNDDKKTQMMKIKSELALDLGLRAAQVGNTDLLLQQVRSPEFKDKLIEQGIAEEGDVEKAVVKTENDILLVERLYKKYYNSFQTAEGSDLVRNTLINRSVIADYFVEKNKQHVTKLNGELAELKTNDPIINDNKHPNIESVIYLEGLKTSEKLLKSYLQSKDLKEDEILSKRGQDELKSIQDKITQYTELTKDTPLLNEFLSNINKDVVAKQAEIIFAEGVNNVQASKISDFRKPETIKKMDASIKESQDKVVNEDFETFKKDVETKSTNNTLTTKEIIALKNENKKDKQKVKYLDQKYKEVYAKENAARNKQKVETTKSEPVKEETDFDGIPEFENTFVNENEVNPAYKQAIDASVAKQDILDLRGFVSDDFALSNPIESTYARNKFQELRNKSREVSEVTKLNNPVETGASDEFEFNEEAQESSSKNPTVGDILNEETSTKEQKDEDSPEFLARTQGEAATRGYIPLFDTTLKNYKSHKYFDVANGNIRIHENHSDLIKTLFGSDLQTGSEVEVQIDKENPYYNRNKDSKNDVPIKVSYKGVTVMYIGTIKGIQNAIKREKEQGHDEKAKELELELVHIQQLRNDINLQDKVFKTKVVYKGNGTVISRGKDKTSLRSVKGIFDKFFALNPGTSLNQTTLFNMENKDEFFSSVSNLKQGVVYGSLESANGTKIPVPLLVSKVNAQQSKELVKSIDNLLTSLNEGKTTEHQEVKDLKDNISKYIKVDRSSQYDKPVGFRVYPQGINEAGEKTDARIEFAYYNTKGKRLIAVIKKNATTQIDWVGIYDESKKIHDLSLFDNDFEKVLQQKYHNVDFARLQSKDKFTYDNKTYPSYKNYLIEENIVQTDVAQVVDSKGKVLSNLFGFDNDFSLEISTDILSDAKAKSEEKKGNFKVGDLFVSSYFEKELKDYEHHGGVEFKDKYTLFNKGLSSSETILEEILKNPLNDNIKDVASFLQSNKSKTSPNIGLNEHLVRSEPAKYRSSTNTILITKKDPLSHAYFQEVVLHELLHAYTVNTIYSNIIFKGKSNTYLNGLDNVEFKEDCPKYVKEFIIKIGVEYNNARNFLSKKYGKTAEALVDEHTNRFYGLSNIFEFISESMVNSSFRNELRDMKEGKSFLTRLYNSIVEFLNKVFKTNLKQSDKDALKRSVSMIKDFIQNTEKVPDYKDVEVIHYSRFVDQFDNKFSREEILEVVNTIEGVILNMVKNKKLDTQEFITDIDKKEGNTIRDEVRTLLNNYHEKLCPESAKGKVQDILDNYHAFFSESIKRLNKTFKITSSFDLSEVKDYQEVRKDWEDLSANQVSNQDRITSQIKMFVKTIPELDSTNIIYTEDEQPIWDRKKSTITGMNKYVDFNVIYPYMVRNLIGARTPSEILNRLRKMGEVYPSFTYMAYQLEKDSNLLAQIESIMGRKYSYDSYVTFLSNYDNGLVVRVDNEAKDTRHDILLANSWNSNLNKLIDDLEDKSKDEFKDKVSRLHTQISILRNDIEGNAEKISELTYELGNTLGLGISISAVKSQIEGMRDWNDFKILQTLDYISTSVINGKKNNSWANLNYLADIESIFTFDIVENSVLSIDGKPLYTIRNPHFLSNWFSLAKSETAEGKQEFETIIKNMTNVPDMEMSNWLWNEKNKEGFINYEIKDKKKVFKSINWSFVNKFSFHNFAGSKETITRTVQKYTDFSDKDWMMINLFNHIQGSKKKGFIQVPVLIPSDSSSMYTLEVPKIALTKGEYHVGKLSRNSLLSQSVRNTARQEVRRIQQATKEVFDIVDNKLVVKEGLDITKLQQYYHFGKEHSYNEDGTINLTETLLNKDGSPKGKAFYFQNMIVKKGSKFTTLNDVEGIMTNYHLEVGEVSPDVISKIDSFVDDFIKQQIDNGIKSHKSLETNVAGKHDSIGNGEFDNLIVEYILNQYIANVEQFNMFNGVIAEYKDKVDTNKRAKQMFAPGTGLSEEAMKMELENGNWSNGKTFRGTTIKDIKTISKSITYITNTVKDKLISERPNAYSHDEIENFNIKKPTTQLEKDVHNIIKGYLSINAGDAQGYSTLDRYESIIRGLGRYNNDFEKAFNNVREGKQLTSEDIKTLQPIKGFYYGREFDSSLNRFVSVQIKYSTFPLIPQLVGGSELEKLMKVMKDKSLDEVFFESAHKVGAKMIYKIDTDGSLNDDLLAKLEATTYYNKNWQLQLDVPEHIVDEQNLLATQIAKLIITNLSNNSIYEVNGVKYTGEKLRERYFNILGENVLESANDLIKDLGVEKTDTGFIVKNESIRKALTEEVEKRGLSENYSYAIELKEGGEFKLPLFVNNMATKWEAILTSLFTNRIVKQKMPGGSAILASRLFLDNSIEQSEYKDKGIEWEKDRLDKTLKSYRDENGVQVVEVVLGAWSKKLYRDGKRISIDEIPTDIRTMIGYRIPTEKKSSMVVFKVVGFLPEESKGLIITPDDIITQMGSDFDIDKMFIMNQNFYRKDDGTFVVPILGKENEEYKTLVAERNALYKELNETAEWKSDPETDLVNDIVGSFGLMSSVEAEADIRKSIKTITDRLKQILEVTNLEKKEYGVKKEGSREARENEIFNIYKSILSNPYHIAESLSPTEFEDFKSLKNEIDTIFNEDESNINPLTEEGQRTFRKRNIGGRALKGIAANFNAFGAIAQNTKMYLNDDISFKFKFNLTKYDKKELQDRYKDKLIIEGNEATITFSNLGYSPDGNYLNVDGKPILQVASQGISAAVDIVKDPTFDSFNATTYTYPVFHTMLLTGVPVRLAGMFIRQPIVKYLNDYYFENKSLLGDNTGNQIETLKRFYQTQLVAELVKDGLALKDFPDIYKTMKRRKESGSVNSMDKKYLIYLKRDDTQKLLGYNPNELAVFDVEHLKKQLELNSNGISKLDSKTKIDYLRTQLQVLEWFNTWKKAGEGVQDLVKVTKTDGLGAGPSLSVTNDLIRTINKIKDNERVLIDSIPAIQKIYPTHFGLTDASKYPILENYLNYGNKLSVDVLKNLFITQSPSFRNVTYTINGMMKRSLDEDEIGKVNKFLNTSLLQGFDKFQGIDKTTLLGVNNTIDSVGNRVAMLQLKKVDYLKENPQHILNFLQPKLDKDDIERNGYHKIDFVFYKNEFTDDNLADSILKMYESGNEEEKQLAIDLVSYSYITNGLGYGLNSFSKVIPNELLFNWGLGDYLNEQKLQADSGTLFTGKTTIDQYFKNNWNTLPIVKTLWDYHKDEEGKTKVRLDKEGEKLTKDNTPIWSSDDGLIAVSKKRFGNVSDIAQSSPFLIISKGEEKLLYKKYTTEVETETGFYTKEVFGNMIYFYEVNKLGKDGIVEFTDNSIFASNNSKFEEQKIVSRINDIVSKAEEQEIKTDKGDNLNLNNTSEDKQNDIEDKCGY